MMVIVTRKHSRQILQQHEVSGGVVAGGADSGDGDGDGGGDQSVL